MKLRVCRYCGKDTSTGKFVSLSRQKTKDIQWSICVHCCIQRKQFNRDWNFVRDV